MDPPRTGRDGKAYMHLSIHDLRQIDEDYLNGLSPEQLWSFS